MNQREILGKVDHTLLTQTAAWQEIRELCDDAVTYGTASVCIPPCYVKQAAEYLEGRMRIGTVVGFPNGYATTAVKCMEAREALESGADEIDMVINLGWLKGGAAGQVEQEIRSVKEVCGSHILKVIVEACLLSEEEKIAMCRMVSWSGADYIKTSTGFSASGATFEDVELFSKFVARRVKIKAAGGIASFQDAEHFLLLGAERLGTSRLVKIMKGAGGEGY